MADQTQHAAAVAGMRQMVGDQVQEMIRLHGERIAAETGNTLNYEQMEQLIVDSVVGYNLNEKVLPRGYKVLGGGKTKFYLTSGSAAAKLNTNQFIMDLFTGLLGEINEFLGRELDNYKRAHGGGK